VKKKSDNYSGSDYLKYLEKEKEISDQIINNSRSMISIINRDYIYQKVNSTFCNAHQLIIESIVGKSPADLWGNETFQKSIKNNIDLCLSGKTVTYEASFMTPVSGRRYFEVIFRPLPDKTGTINQILAETFDITDLMHSKQALIEKAEELRKFETLGTLAAGIAHDFNNILTTISGYSEMLKDDLPETSELSEKVGKIQGAVLKARSVTSKMLSFNLQSDLGKKVISVSAVLRETLEFIRSAIPSGINVKCRIPVKEINVFADPTQLFRVFFNLITNAVQAMEKEGGTLSVNLTVVEGKRIQHLLNHDVITDKYALLTFKDTGKGIEPQLIERIFEPYFTTNETGKGTGLGLSVVNEIVSDMEGKILISSKKKKGSIFYVYIPVAMNDQDKNY
jgi:PAS domain S-box-containing protein